MGLAVGGVLVLLTLGSMNSWGPLVEIVPRTVEPVEPEFTVEPPPTSMPPLFPDEEPPRSSWELPSWVAELLRALAIATALGLLIWFVSLVLRALRGRRLVRAAAATGAAVAMELDEEEIAESLTTTLERLRAGVAVDDAIVQCWRRLETVAELSGISRLPTQTSQEFTVSILTHAVVDPAALEELASLYRQALFSTHILTDAHRDRAVASLEQLIAQLGPEVEQHAE